jgi:prophage regulatory protein
MAQTSEPQGNTRILRRRQVETITGWARSTIYQGIAEGRFPRPIRLGARSVGWLAQEIEDWIQSRIVESRPVSNETKS